MISLAVALALYAVAVAAQVPAAELAPLLHGLEHPPAQQLEARVPLMTDDDTVSPLFSVQVHAPTDIPTRGTSCTLKLLEHEFGVGSYNAPAVVPYTPPGDAACGPVGKWAAVTMNLSVSATGTQYDRLAVESYRTSRDQ